jgi:hypothetical protein
MMAPCKETVTMAKQEKNSEHIFYTSAIQHTKKTVKEMNNINI